MSKLFKTVLTNSQHGAANERGSGLGLMLSHEFIEKQGGNLRVESKPGEGSRFIISLPVHF